MPPRIRLGINLNFAKFVYGRRRAIDVVRDELGLRTVEAVPDIDFGPMLFQTSPEVFRRFHRDVAAHARDRGVDIASVLTFYRDCGAIAHHRHQVREAAYRVGLSILEMAACYGARYCSASLFTMDKERADDPEQFQSLFDSAISIWRRWMSDAKRLGIGSMLIEMASTFREGFSTIEDSRLTLELLDAHHWRNADTTVPVGICYDTGHGISEDESADPRDRDFQAWFEAFPGRIHEIHLKNTDSEFQDTFHFGDDRGIIDLDRLVRAIRDTLTVPELLLMLEVPGKRGREIGERRAIEDHRRSIALVNEALARNGYGESEGAWVA